MHTITHPTDPTFSGVHTGLIFSNGQAETDEPALIGYYQGAGFLVNGVQLNPVRSTDRSAYPDPRNHPPVLLGTPLRDAAVDPQPGDIAPAGAGEHNPHGPDVVADIVGSPSHAQRIAEIEAEAQAAAERDALEKAAKAEARKAAKKAAPPAA